MRNTHEANGFNLAPLTGQERQYSNWRINNATLEWLG